MYNKKKKVIGFISIVLFLIFCLLFYTPKKFVIEKIFSCKELETNEEFIVNVSGTYYKFFLKDDIFDGTIEVEGKRIQTGKFHFREDMYTNFNDTYGQPQGLVLQFKQFSYIAIADDGYNICSEWNADWKEELEEQENFQKFLGFFKK